MKLTLCLLLVTYIFEYSDLVLNSFDNLRSIHRFDEANIIFSCSRENDVSLVESFVSYIAFPTSCPFHLIEKIYIVAIHIHASELY